MKKSSDALAAELFTGSESDAIAFLERVRRVGDVANELEGLFWDGITEEEKRYFRRAFGTVVAELHAKISIPIQAKYPQLK